MRAQLKHIPPDLPRPAPGRRHRQALPIAAAAFALALAAYVADVISHPQLLNWFDLGVYNGAGTIARHSPAALYSWRMRPGVKFTYPPFAAIAFACTSLLPWGLLTWLMTVSSLLAVPAVAWFTFGALGWRGRNRAAAALALSAVALWTDPVQRALLLGQVEILLMLLIVWDVCQPDRRWWKGAGIGLAAGIKLVPLIFIPYLLLTGRLRQAAVATSAFALTVVIGFVLLPQASVKWWLTGYFLHPGKVGGVGALVNQSVLGLLIRVTGTLAAATPVWLAASAVIGITGLAAAAILYRRGRPVVGWAACALTGLLVSPVSWDHHWVWIVPILAVLADGAVRTRGSARWGYGALATALTMIFLGWPDHLTGPKALRPDGLLGFFPSPSDMQRIKRGADYHLHGIQLISWNLFVLAGLVLLALLIAAAFRERSG